MTTQQDYIEIEIKPEHKKYFSFLLSNEDYLTDKKISLLDYIKIEKSLNIAHEIRKFEIEMYWKRATYFWAFLTVLITAYGATYSIPYSDIIKPWIQWFVCIVGFIFSIAFYAVNVGSKFWQANWERSVDALEFYITGNLYKINFTGKGNYSVSTINKWLSIVICLCWLIIIFFHSILYINDGNGLSMLISSVIAPVLLVIIMCIFTKSEHASTANSDDEYFFKTRNPKFNKKIS